MRSRPRFRRGPASGRAREAPDRRERRRGRGEKAGAGRASRPCGEVRVPGDAGLRRVAPYVNPA